jgi:hypothetical protein
MNDARWPPLPLDAWRDTYATLHLWTQVVGKVALAQAPPLNHGWGIAFHLTPRGFATQTLPYGERTFAIEFDFIAHQLVIRASDGDLRTLALAPKSVADFYSEVMTALREMSLPVSIWPVAVEVPVSIRLDRDRDHHAYDADAAHRCWRILASITRVFNASRCDFVGKSSPAHFFWGSFDLATTRFSGRPAPPREGPAFMQEAYSHEVISHGFWPGGVWPGGPVLDAAFYGYAAPAPAGLEAASVRPAEAYYHRELGEFILPYEAVRTAASPERAIEDFMTSTYEAAATLAKWDRAALERPRPVRTSAARGTP